MKKTHMAYSIACLLFVLGLLVTFRAIQLTPVMRSRIQRKLTDLHELRALAEQSGDTVALWKMFEQLQIRQPRPLTEIAEATDLPRPAIRRRESAQAAGGWNLITMTATFEDVPLARLSSFIREAGATGTRPSWRLIECNISALDQGRGRAELVLEALEKPES